MKDDNRFLLYGMAALVILNITVFFIAAMSPVLWMPNEIASHRFFWSMDGIDQFTLHSGIRKTDFLKIFAAKYVDGIFRPRQFSYLIEMLSFKFWQYLGIGFFKNYTIIGLHIANTVLLWRLLFLLTRRKGMSWVGALLFLNSGIPMATILFPFRNAKILVVTLFLACWICIAGTERKFLRMGISRQAFFLTGLMLALFTDEIAFFIFPLLIVYAALREGGGLLRSKQLWAGVLFVGVVFAGLTGFFYACSLKLSGETGEGRHLIFLFRLGGYLANPRTFLDVTKAFFVFFLRRNFGYWDFTLWGSLAFMAGIILTAAVLPLKQNRLLGRIALAIGIVIAIKALLLPHNSGVHEAIMPPGTGFPSLFFFSYYYAYADALLIALGMAILLDQPRVSLRKINGLLFLVLIMGFSNWAHLKHGPRDAVVFHGADDVGRQRKVERAQKIKEVLSLNPCPVYLSFPSGNSSVLKGRFGDGEWTTLASYIPVMYLRAIEKGEVIISLDNIKTQREKEMGEDLSKAKTFFDVQTGQTIKFDDIKRKNEPSDLLSVEISGMAERTLGFSQKALKRNTIVFFVKGKADLLVLDGNKTFSAQQTYGQSYQMFLLKLDEEDAKRTDKKQLKIDAEGNKVRIVGPLIF